MLRILSALLIGIVLGFALTMAGISTGVVKVWMLAGCIQ